MNEGGKLSIAGACPDKPFNMCQTFKDHGFSLAALSETRWKGEGAIDVDDYKILYCGLSLDAPVSLYGVGIALNPAMQTAWKAAGCVMEGCPGRLLRITLKIAQRTFHVIAVYAPTFRAAEVEKEQFYKDLSTMVSKHM